MTMEYRTHEKTVEELADLFDDDRLDLTPAFQRDSVWTDADRSKLIESILRGWPLPSIFLHRSQDSRGNYTYAVIDGKQRLETLFEFIGRIRAREAFREAWIELPSDNDELESEWITFRALCKRFEQYKILGYRIHAVEVSGELGEVIDLFVRINSTGKALTRAEKRNAQFNEVPLLREARRLAGQFATYLRSTKVITATQRSRMKDVELMCDLIVSAHLHDVASGRTAAEKALHTQSIKGAELTAAVRSAARGLNRLAAMFPNLVATRFHALSDFYTLAVLIQKFDRDGLILTDAKRNAIAERLLEQFSVKVDTIKEKSKRVEAAGPDDSVYLQYYQTVREGTSEARQRRTREQILRAILEPVFEKTDLKRLFTPEQRRIIWNSTAEKKCSECGKKLTWNDVTIDHVFPHSRGGRTSVKNAALMCRQHNSAKGAKVAAPKRRVTRA